MGAMKDIYTITHYGTKTHDYEWEEHFPDSRTNYYRVRIYIFDGVAYLTEHKNGMLLHFDKLDKELE